MRLGSIRAFLALLVALSLTTGSVLVACSSFSSGNSPASSADSGGSSDGEAGTAVPFCVGPSAFCADFDKPALDVWDQISIDDAGTLALSNGTAVSPPSALRATMKPPPAGGECRSAIRLRGLDVAAPRGFAVEYAILPGGPGGSLPGELVIGVSVVAKDVVGHTCEYYFSAGPNVAELVVEPRADDGGTPSSKILPLSQKLLGGVWARVGFELQGAAGASRTVRATFDGQEVRAATAVPDFCRDAVQITEIQVGLHCVGDGVGGNVEAWFDNIRLTASP